MRVFGPIPSRRLGRSLGLNNIPPKTCSYSCVYCQLGRTRNYQIERETYQSIGEVEEDITTYLERLDPATSPIDYLTFIADGEPTLDGNLGETIAQIKRAVDLPIAIISNASLIYRSDVSEDLSRADWVSLKCDAVNPDTWRRINRPHPELDHSSILGGIASFAKSFRGTLCTETMLVEGFNDGIDELRQLAQFITAISPDRAYIAIPTRPPAEAFARKPPQRTVELAREIYAQAGIDVHLLVDYEGDDFSTTGDAVDDLLRITEVHPMKERAVQSLLNRCGKDWDTVRGLVQEELLTTVDFAEETFYIRGKARGEGPDPDGRLPRVNRD